MSFNNLFQSGVLELIKVIRNYDFNDKKKNMSNEELVKLYQDGDKSALDELIQANTGIISKIANRYNGINRELEFDDLFQSGVLGLIAVAKKYKFDIENKAKFITYAVHYINRYINSCVNGKTSKDIENNKFYHQCTSLNKPTGEDEEIEVGDSVAYVDYGFEKNENIEVVIRPEDIKMVDADKGMLKGLVTSVVFKGVHYEMAVQENENTWFIHSTKMAEEGSMLGMDIYPVDIHILRKVCDQ